MNTFDVKPLFDKVVAELAVQGLVLPFGWKFELDSARRRFGCCDHGRRVISISRPLAELNAEKEVEATIRHEIAHALVGPGHGHDAAWRRMALRCGDDGRRCYDSATVKTPEMPWSATCPKCGRVAGRTRPVKPGRRISCGPCSGGRFDARYELKFECAAKAAFEKIAAFVPGQPNVIQANSEADGKIAAVLAMRMKGMGFVAIDAAFGIYGKKGWWSWKICRDQLATKEMMK